MRSGTATAATILSSSSSLATTATMTTSAPIPNEGDTHISKKTPFIRELAASDRKTRDKALDSLTRFLRARDDLDLLELLRVWKGLFFCFYHSDRPLTQQALARSLSYALVPQLPRSRGFLLRFLRAFWITIGREFHALDRLRLDKYLFLIRCYVAAGFEVFVKQKVLAKRGKDANADDNDRKKRKREWNSLGHATNVNTRNSNNRTNNNKKSKLQKRDSDAQKYDNEHDDNQGKHTGGEINQNHHVIDEGDGSSNDNWTDLESYISMLEEGPLSPLNFKPNSNIKSSNKSGSYSRPPSQTNGNTIPMPLGPDGLRYHIMDVWFDELGKVLELDSTEFTEDFNATGKPTSHNPDVPIDLLLRPFVILRKESPMKTVRQRAEQVIDDQRLVMWGFREAKKVDDDDESVEDDEEWGGFDD